MPEKMFPDLCSEGVLEVYLDTFDKNGIKSFLQVELGYRLSIIQIEIYLEVYWQSRYY